MSMTIADQIARVRANRDAKRAEREQHERTIDEIAGRLMSERRDLTTPEEATRAMAAKRAIQQLDEELRDFDARILELEDDQRSDAAAAKVARRMGGADDTAGRWVRSHDGRPAAVERGSSFASHEIVREHSARIDQREQAVIGQHGSLGQLVRAMSTTSGSAIVPTTWSADLIDRARNKAAVLKAGAQIVPMDAKTVQIGRITGDPNVGFRSEGSAITASDPTFDNVTLDSKTMSALVVGSLEWFQDSANADEIVAEAIAEAIALQIDLVSLYGGVTAGAGAINLPTPPNPRGVLAALLANAPSSVLGAAANGTTQTVGSFWNEVLDTVFTVRDFNEEPNGLIWASKLARQYAKAYDTTGQPLTIPAAVAEVPQYVSNQVPSYTQGTMANRATDLFAGDWTQLIIGQRLDLTIQTLTERYAENGQVGIVAHWRGDVQPARPRAFSVYRAIQGA